MNFCQDLARMIVGRIEQDLARSYFLVKEKSPKKTSKIALKICLKIRFFQFFSIKKFPVQESSVGPRAGPPRAGPGFFGPGRPGPLTLGPRPARPETGPGRLGPGRKKPGPARTKKPVPARGLFGYYPVF